ncbi:MAG: hypothetical protein ACOC3D_11315 [Pseudomonadota bacterium]
MNALTHGLRAQGPRSEIDVEDRLRRAAVLIDTLEPEDDFEVALVHRMAGAFQRLEKADHLESEVLDAAVVVGTGTSSGALLANQKRVQGGFCAINRYRATAQADLYAAWRMLEAYRHQRDALAPVLPNEATP